MSGRQIELVRFPIERHGARTLDRLDRFRNRVPVFACVPDNGQCSALAIR